MRVTVQGEQLAARGSRSAPLLLSDGEALNLLDTAQYRVSAGKSFTISLEVTEWDVLSADSDMDHARDSISLTAYNFGDFAIEVGAPGCSVRLDLHVV